MLITLVLAPRPEEPAQAVLAHPGDMRVQVRDALRDDVVDRDEGSLGAHRLGNGTAEQLGAGEERRQQRRRQVGERLVVGAGDERVAGKRGGSRGRRSEVVLEHYLGLSLPGDDRAEGALGRHWLGDDRQRARVDPQLELECRPM